MTLEELILKIIKEEEIQDQKTLLKKIARRGHEIDQSTLSRILKKLNIEKHLGKYVVLESPISQKYSVENQIIAVPPNLIIIKTKPGFASAVSISIEENRIEGVVGTIAGDDTIFIAVTNKLPINELKEKIECKIKKLGTA